MARFDKEGDVETGLGILPHLGLIWNGPASPG